MNLWLVLFVLALVATAGLFVYVNDAWHTHTRGDKALRTGVLTVFAVVTYGAGEAYLVGSPIGPRVPALIVAFLSVIAGIWLVRRSSH